MDYSLKKGNKKIDRKLDFKYELWISHSLNSEP